MRAAVCSNAVAILSAGDSNPATLGVVPWAQGRVLAGVRLRVHRRMVRLDLGGGLARETAHYRVLVRLRDVPQNLHRLGRADLPERVLQTAMS